MKVEIGQVLYRADHADVAAGRVESMTVHQCIVRSFTTWRVRESELGVRWFTTEAEARNKVLADLDAEITRLSKRVEELRGRRQRAETSPVEQYEDAAPAALSL